MTNRHTGSQWYDTMATHGNMTASDRPVTAPVGRPAPHTSRHLIVLAALVFAAIVIGLLLAGSEKPSTSPVAPLASVELFSRVTVTGTCQKNLVGEYSLTATIRADNASNTPQRGTIWVSWPVTGQASKRYGETFEIDPGRAIEYPVSKPVSAQTWLATGECTYGWDPQR